MKTKKMVYVSNMCSEKKLQELFQENFHGVPQQIQRYHRILVDGLSKREHFQLDVLSALPITKNNSSLKKAPKDLQRENGISYHYLATINSPLWKRMGDFLGGFFHVISCKQIDTILVVDILDVCVVLGAIFAAKIKKIPIIGIVTDIPDYLFVIGKMHAKLANKNIQLCDAYILLTKQMNKIVNPTNKKPYIVMEGHVPSEETAEVDVENYEKNTEFVCLYAGILDKRYGVADLVQGFLLAKLPNARLDLYGEGAYKEEIIELASKHPQIRYQGVKQNKEIVLEEKKASLLINPRPSTEEFVKYSFPSKNLEYMVSGTPVLTTSLPGMPEEYKEYVYQIEEESSAGIAKMLTLIFSKTEEEQRNFGKRAKNFVKTYKSADAQARKVEDFVRKNYE